MSTASKKKALSRDAAQAGPAQASELLSDASFPGRFLLVILALYLLFASAYNHLVPFRAGTHAAALIRSGQLAVNPDEAAHVANAEVYRSGHLPVFHSGSPDFEAHQPPLYYLLIAPFIQPGADEPAKTARWVSILLGALGIAFAYFAVREMFPGRPEIALGTAAFAGLLPMNVSLCASISNDVLTNTIVALGIWQCARIAMRLEYWTDKHLACESALLGVVLALGIYAKTSTLVLFPMVVAVGLMLAWLKLAPWRRSALFIGVSCALGVALALPWLIRNTLIYGDPVAQHIFQTAFIGTTETAQDMQRRLGGAGAYWSAELKLTFESFWGVFDAMQVGMPQWIYGVLLAFSLVCALGWIKSKPWEALSPTQKALAIGLAALGASTLAGYLRFNMTFFQAQGRYLFPALIPCGIVFACGLGEFIKRPNTREPKSTLARTDTVVLVIAGAMAILNVYCILLINQIFPPVQ